MLLAVGCDGGGSVDPAPDSDTMAADLAIVDGLPPDDSSVDAAPADVVVPSDAALPDGALPDAALPDGAAPECGDDWEAIREGLAAYADLLPTRPEVPLRADFEAPVPALRYDRIAPVDPGADWALDDSTCEVQGGWPAERVQVGPLVERDGEPHCRVLASPTPNRGDGDLVFSARWPWNNIHAPAGDEPAWVRARFPIPPGHRASRLVYVARWARLFGYPIDACADQERDDAGDCAPFVDPPWAGGSAPPGLLLLWGVPGGCGWHTTGPHAPAAETTYSGSVSYSVEVPEALRDAPELVVALVVYRQYNGGCDADGRCVNGLGYASNLNLRALTLETRAAFEPPRTPPLEHPRLHGDAAHWAARNAAFDALPCEAGPGVPSGAGWGEIPNLRNLWDLASLGTTRCEDDAVDVEDNRLVAYLAQGGDRNRARALQALHLLRRAAACVDAGGPDCPLLPHRLDALRDTFIEHELAAFDGWSWGGNLGFDLHTTPTIRFWSLFADVLWAHLTPEERARIQDTARPHIEAFLDHVHNGRWPTHNGNNWTPVLGEGALHWAIAFWHEEPLAPEVARAALEIQWLHRGFYLPDGAYQEGLLEYTQVSFGGLESIRALAEASFGLRTASPRRARWPLTARWMIDFMAPDGRTVDFADSWSKRGWGTLAPLLLALGEDGDRPGACLARDYFANKWFDHGYRDPWRLDPRLALDWRAHVAACEGGPAVGTAVHHYPAGGWGGLRSTVPGATAAARELASARAAQADQTFVAISAIPNARPHTELDFGAVVWSAHGNRLLSDFGYGDLGQDRYDFARFPDQNPTGHNTLVIEGARRDDEPGTNTSQIDGAAGTIDTWDLEIAGAPTASVLHVEGAAVYGRDDPELGWLSRFDRWVVSLPGGAFAVADAFALRDDRPDARVVEHWHWEEADAPPDEAGCDMQHTHVDAQLDAAGRLTLEPRCHGLRRGAPAESVGHLVGAAQAAGHLELAPSVRYPNRLGHEERRGRARWIPDAPQRSDLRVFVLAAGTRASPPSATVERADCEGAVCFDVRLPGIPDGDRRLHFVDDRLVDVTRR